MFGFWRRKKDDECGGELEEELEELEEKEPEYKFVVTLRLISRTAKFSIVGFKRPIDSPEWRRFIRWYTSKPESQFFIMQFDKGEQLMIRRHDILDWKIDREEV